MERIIQRSTGREALSGARETSTRNPEKDQNGHNTDGVDHGKRCFFFFTLTKLFHVSETWFFISEMKIIPPRSHEDENKMKDGKMPKTSMRGLAFQCPEI